VLVAPDALRRLDAEREAAGVAASRVVIELTERRTVADLRQLRRTVSRLREAGYGIAIDDIGPTMPRYEALLDMPFTTIKLDKYVVTRSAVAGDTAEFVKRVIARAKARGLVVVVEGVEDVQTWNRMRRAGADLAQGFVIARPLPAAALPAWKDAWRSRTDLG
jgi:EAL domain-containing protein (putative c-di-GMP-specific phosphodiesterase class I)